MMHARTFTAIFSRFRLLDAAMLQTADAAIR